MKKVLVVHNPLKNGGMENIIMNICRYTDKEKLTFDLLSFVDEPGDFDDEFRSFGGQIYNRPIKKFKNKILNRVLELPCTLKIIKDLNRRNGPYDVIHSHHTFWSGVILLGGWLNGIPIRIAHLHFGCLPIGGQVEKIYRKLLVIMINIFATKKVVCSEKSGKWFYGEKGYRKDDVVVLSGGVSFEEFNKGKYNITNLRVKYDIKDSNINFIQIGRFAKDKNQIFSIRILEEIKKKHSNISLILIGYGEEEHNIKENIKALELEDYVRILPKDTNIPEILACMDYMIFPSKEEGFGLVAIEAQAMGVRCFASVGVSEEVDIGLCDFIELEKGERYWAEYIYGKFKESKSIDREKAKKYDLLYVKDKIEKIYRI